MSLGTLIAKGARKLSGKTPTKNKKKAADNKNEVRDRADKKSDKKLLPIY